MKYLFILCFIQLVSGLNVVIPGGTGPFGRALAAKLSDHKVVVLARNAFLAAAPSRVTNEFGYLGEQYLKNNLHVSLRDWDGGDLLDIVGKDFLGWQQDTLAKANCVVIMTGGYTEQRTMATERIVRESLAYNRKATIITVSPENVEELSPGVKSLKEKRIQLCEDMVKQNCENHVCLRLPANRIEESCDRIVNIIQGLS